MNVAVMAALAVVIFAEKLWRHGKPFGQAAGVLLVAIGCWPSGSRGCLLACTSPP
jgi:predicted metal-binding membrane protein